MIKLKQQRLAGKFIFTKTKKILFGFLAFFAVLLIAGCQSSPSQSSKTNKSSQTDKSPQTIKAPQDLTKDQQGTWKWTDQQMTIQKVFLASNIKKLAAVLMLDDFDKVKMTMTIKDKTVELKYHFDYRELYEDQAFATGENKANYESYLKNKTAEFKNYIPNLKHTKITLDEPNYAYDYSLTGEIDTQKHTITFPETPTFLSRIVMGTTYNSLVPITYTYTVEGNQLTLYAEGKDEQSHFRVIRLRFNYVGDNH